MTEQPPTPITFDDPWRPLLHRWLFQHNPLYLLSAALVLVGVILSSRGLAGGGTAAQLGVALIAELYTWALIGGAALLVRIRLRRPAVMLVLLAALYQCDLTLHTETCAYLGLAGVMGSVGWWLSFVVKWRAIAWAIQLRLSRSAVMVTSAGAAFVAGFPWALRVVDGETASSWLALGVFAVFAAALWTRRIVHGRVTWSPWAATVARRSIRATWIGLGAMVLLHVGFWRSQSASLELAALGPAAALLATRWARRESTRWLMVTGTLLGVIVKAPELVSLTAIMAAATLGLLALRGPAPARPPLPIVPPAPPADVYRVDAFAPAPALTPPPAPMIPEFVVPGREERLRLLTGVVGCVYLAVWTHGWSSWPLPPHVVWLDALLLAASVAIWFAHRRGLALVLPTLGAVHLALALELVSQPRTTLQWGIACIVAGFGLLLLCLAASVYWRRRAAPVHAGHAVSGAG